MEYNTQMDKLILPEYGRNIQKMVDHCLTIADREERTACAYSIVNTMGNLFPELRDMADYKHILWDHLAIMAHFQLDIDYPCDVVKEEKLATHPKTVAYSQPDCIHFRQYGKLVQSMIDEACKMEEGEERDALEYMIANFMKKCYITYNKDSVEDEKIFDDQTWLSQGQIRLQNKGIKLEEYKAPVVAATSGKKKKKK